MEYLSDAWLSALDGALAPVRALAPLVIEQVVTGVPGRGEVRYFVSFDEAGGHVRTTGRAADIVLRTDYSTATAIAQGRENAQSALAAGRLRLGGEIEVLVRNADALAALGDATADVRAATTYAGESP